MLLDPGATQNAVSYPARIAAVTPTMFVCILGDAYIALTHWGGMLGAVTIPWEW